MSSNDCMAAAVSADSAVCVNVFPCSSVTSYSNHSLFGSDWVAGKTSYSSEPSHDKTNKVSVRLVKTQISLIRAFSVRMKKVWVLSRCPG